VNSIGLCVCEVCGSQSADHAGWFAVAEAGSQVEILPWKDELRTRDDCHHACCGEHLQKLIFSSAARELSRHAATISSHKGGWHPLALVPTGEAKPSTSNEEAILSVLAEIDAVLQEKTEDEDEQPSFDA
jgi:hypothetical protein